MNRTCVSSRKLALPTGGAVIVGDPALTLLSVDTGFRSFFKAVPKELAVGESLASVPGLGPLTTVLHEMLTCCDLHCESDCAFALDARFFQFHIVAMRMEGRSHAGYSVYHLLLADLSELAAKEREAELERRKYESISELLEDIPFEYDPFTDTMSYAEKFRTVFGGEPNLPRFRERLAAGEAPDAISAFFHEPLARLPFVPDVFPECSVAVANGDSRWFSIMCTTVTDAVGALVKVVGVIRNIDRQKREQLRLLDKSRTDAMTGLLNKATTEEEIREALGCVRPGSVGVLLMLDLDNFKLVNDTLGHLAGDEVLIQVSRLLLRAFSSKDIIGRVGGDEFHVFMREVGDVDFVHEKARELCSLVRKLFAGGNWDSSLSLSIGIACAEQAIAYKELFRQADAALYRAKANGKNRYEVFGSASAGEGGEDDGQAAPVLTTRTARNSIVVDILDTLFSTGDLRKGIDKALDFIGNALNIGAIFIFEKSFDLQRISITHAWTSGKGDLAWAGHCRDVPVESLHLPCGTGPDGIFYCSDVQALPPEGATFRKDPAVTSFLQCDIVRDDMVVGYISFEERGNKRIWMQQEIDALVLMAKLISGKVSQGQSARLLHQSNESTRDILNSLPGTSVCVIAKASRRLLYFNGRVSEQFPGVSLGMPCKELFKCRNAACESCPRLACPEGQSAHTLLHDTAFGKIARLAVSSILWENREDAHVALISEYVPSAEEQELQKKKETYIQALCSTYDYVLDVDCSTGQYTLLTLSENMVRLFPERGQYRAVHDTASAVHIVPEEREDFRKRFSLGEMLRIFGQGVASHEMEHRWLERRRTLWKHRVALPYRLEDGSFHILMYVRDISAQKEKEVRSREDGVNYLLALQSSYSEIFRIDGNSRRIAPVYYNSEQVLIPNAMDFNLFIRQRAAKRVHPDSLDAYLTFYEPERVRESIRRGENIQCEYRKRQTEFAAYQWISATIRPVPGAPGNALLLLQDVTRSREAENHFYEVLRSSYDEIFEMDLDADRIIPISLSDETRPPIALSFVFSQDTRKLAEDCVHPEDREGFLAFYDARALKKKLDEKGRLSAQYRILGSDNVYRWLDTLVLPLPGVSTCKVLILGKNITDRKRMEVINRRLEERYTAVFRQSCDLVTQVVLDGGTYSQRSFSELALPLPHYASYEDWLEALGGLVHADDWPGVQTVCGLEGLRKAFAERRDDCSCRFRLRHADEFIWLENRVFFIREGGNEAFVLTRDISAQKRLEEERALEEARFTLALRDTYTEIYEFNIDTETSTLLFSSSGLLSPVGTGDLVRTRDIIAQALHPDDRAHVAASFLGSQVRENFERGVPEVVEEFRRLGVDDEYHWVSAVLVPVREEDHVRSKAMLFVKDISQRKKQEQQERITEQYSLALRNIYDQLYEVNISEDSYRLIYNARNRYATPPEGGRSSRLISGIVRRMTHPEDRAGLRAFFALDDVRRHFAQGHEYRTGEFRILRTEGRFYWTSLTMFPATGAVGDDEAYLLFVMDIDARKQADAIAQQNAMLERQRIADERYRIIVEQTSTLVFEWNEGRSNRYLSSDLIRHFAGNYDERDLLRVWQEDGVVHPEDMPDFMTFVEHYAERDRQEMLVRFRLRNESFIWCKVALSRLQDANGGGCRYIGTLNDVDEATRSTRDLRYRAEYDTLTGICNAATFNMRAAKVMHDFPERQYAIIRMDIDRFKVVNDLYGIEEGDRLLKAIAQMLDKRMTGHSLCSRLSGDVFCACVDFSEQEILRFVREMTEELERYPLPSAIVPSFGICRVDNVDTPINMLCDWANLALNKIKGNVVVTHAFYDEKLRERILSEKKIESEMHGALLADQFHLYLQPKVDIPSGRIIGAEGLVRWQHPSEGLIAPAHFIPLFEKNGFIIQLDEYIWEQACKCLRSWIDRGLTPLPLSVNVSRLHAHDPHLCEKLSALMGKYRLPLELLELELTESVFLDSENQLISVADKLMQLGFPLSLDDFGAGYSSLNALKNLPVRIIKIDRGFLGEVVATERGKTVIRHTIALARSMNIDVIAEGVETAEQAAFLAEAECRLAQGFYYAPPLPLDRFEILAFGEIPQFPLVEGRSQFPGQVA